MTALPAQLTRNVTATWGADGERWLAGLPATLAGLARDWRLELGAPFAPSYHWVCRVRIEDGLPAVLKVGLPDARHLAQEAAALAAWDGSGAVRLLRFEAARGALLLELARPGTSAAQLVPDDDEQASAAAVAVLRRLHTATPPATGVPALAELGAAFDGHLGDPARARLLPRSLVERARDLFAQLCASAPGTVLLHGDLHHDNVLRAERERWLAVDPHGAVGDPGYDAGSWLYNPDPDRCGDALPVLLPARVEQLADGLGQPMDRLVAWGFVKAVLSAVWTCETGSAPRDRTLDVAALLLPQLP
jgi:streptomycin 6-kinase